MIKPISRSKFIICITDVTDEQFEIITNLELEKYHCIVNNKGVITSRICFKVHYCLKSVFNLSINRHFQGSLIVRNDLTVIRP